MSSSLHDWNGALAAGAVALAAAIAAGLIVLLRPLLAQYALARPNARSSHTIPTPQGGGIAVLSATALASLLVLIPNPGASAALLPVMAGALVLAVLGAVDDIRTVGVFPRIALQTAVIAVVIVTLPELPTIQGIPAGPQILLLIVAGVWFVNLVNFMDGIDWMTVATVVPVTGALAVIGAMGGLPGTAAVVSLSLFGAMLGFAPFNRPVAKLFLGDVGSLPIGLLVGWMLLLLAGSGHIAAAILLPLYYLADATITLLRRVRNGEKFWEAHRTHFYQRALAQGYTVSEIIARVFIVNVALAGLAIGTVAYPRTPVAAAALAIGAVLVALLLFVLARGPLKQRQTQ